MHVHSLKLCSLAVFRWPMASPTGLPHASTAERVCPCLLCFICLAQELKEVQVNADEPEPGSLMVPAEGDPPAEADMKREC